MSEVEEFTEEYDNIHETLCDLHWNTNNKELKSEINDLLAILEEDFGKERDNAEEVLQKEYEEEMDYMNYQHEKDKF